jgi:glycosyltransferase involved in cell wall biosynthesis
MAFGNCIVVHDTLENLETVGDAGFAYDGDVGAQDLRQVLRGLLLQPDLVSEYRRRARARAQAYYAWDAVTDAYERLFYHLCGKPPPERLVEVATPGP